MYQSFLKSLKGLEASTYRAVTLPRDTHCQRRVLQCETLSLGAACIVTPRACRYIQLHPCLLQELSRIHKCFQQELRSQRHKSLFIVSIPAKLDDASGSSLVESNMGIQRNHLGNPRATVQITFCAFTTVQKSLPQDASWHLVFLCLVCCLESLFAWDRDICVREEGAS